MTGRPGTKKILLISYHFPPSTAVGGVRIADFAKYLPVYGWNTYVLTIKDKYLEKQDPGRLKGIAVEKIYKAGQLPTLLQGYLKLKDVFHRISRIRTTESGEQQNRSLQSNNSFSAQEKSVSRLKRFVVSFLTLPDPERNWVLPACSRAIREIKRENIECILTSSPPYSVHLIGLLVKMITGVRWVADFRDPWASCGHRRLSVTSSLSKKLELWLEKKVIEKADLVLTTTRKLRDHFTAAYPSVPESKFVHITNGFSPELADQLKHLSKFDTFTLTYTGTLYVGRDPSPIFRAVQELVQEGKLDPRQIKVKLVGSCRFIDTMPISGIIRSYGLDSSVEVLDTVPQATALEIIKRSHIALLFAPNQPYQIPAKVFEYMGVGTNILALTEKGATRDLITSTGAGSAFLPTDIDGIKGFIESSISNKAAEDDQTYQKIRQQFDRRLILRELAERLNCMTGHQAFMNVGAADTGKNGDCANV